MTSRSGLSAAESDRRDALVERIAADAVGTFDLLHVYLGERLGLFAALAGLGPATGPEVAARTGLDPRYVREWLEQGAIAGLLDVDDATDADLRRFGLPAGHREALLDRDSLSYSTPTAISLLGTIQQLLPAVLDVFRTGGGLRFEASGDDLGEGEALSNRPMYLSLLGQVWLPSIEDVHARLLADPPARVADIGMGHGWSSIGMALAYPRITVDGVDLDGPSVEAAKRNAAAAGVADRVRFANRTAADPALAGRYDLVTAFECLHDMSRPVDVLRTMHALLADGGSVLVADSKADDEFRAPGDQLQRNLYGWSVLHCLSSAMDGPEPAGTGTAIRPSTVRRYAAEAGFGQVEVVPIEHDSWRFYRLRH